MMDVVIRKAFLLSRFLLVLLLVLVFGVFWVVEAEVEAGVAVVAGAGITIFEVVLKHGFVVVDRFNLPTSTDSREWKMIIKVKTAIHSHDTTSDLNTIQSAGNTYNSIVLVTTNSVHANIK